MTKIIMNVIVMMMILDIITSIIVFKRICYIRQNAR